MRKLFTLFAMLLGMLSFVGCSDTPTEPTPQKPTETPAITISEVEVTEDSFTFTVTTNVAGTLGYIVSPADFEMPKVDEWFVANSKEIADTETITLSGLNDNTAYNLYAILRATDSGQLSAPKSTKFTTLDDGIANPIVINNTTYDTISFSINLTGNYVFQCIDAAYLEYNGLTIESYISTLGIGIPASGPIEVEWVDGLAYGNYTMHVREDSDYYVIAAIANGQEVVGEIYHASTRTPKRPQSNAGLVTELTNISSTSVNIKTTPDSTVVEYYVLVRDKVWSDSIVAGYGETMLATLVKYPSAGSWHLTETNEAVWGGLTTNTEYICHVVIIDNKGAEALTLIPFTTLAPSMSAPNVEASLTVAAENGHNTLNINLYSTDAQSVKVAFNTLADVESVRKQYEYSDADIARIYGMDLTAEQVAAVKSTGLSLKQEDLFPEAEYVAIISVKNAENTETVKVVSKKTDAKPIPARVESDLFTSLLGEWKVSYDLIQFNNKQVRITDVPVTIAAGADESNVDYFRNQNRLVVQGWPFNVNGDGTHEPMPYYSPEFLKEQSSYWANNPALALRDFGPKIFLEIGEGDVVTVPSSKGELFYNWGEDGTFYFYGADVENGWTAPTTFPVTISEDGNTIVIGICHAGQEYDNGNYRPSVFRLNSSLDAWAIATSDIILQRVK
ncbi:MAG: hypothetical protein J6U93_00405 [Alistipes sp.]|nr:hypothetical protein [Alistipes sp.]